MYQRSGYGAALGACGGAGQPGPSSDGGAPLPGPQFSQARVGRVLPSGDQKRKGMERCTEVTESGSPIRLELSGSVLP